MALNIGNAASDPLLPVVPRLTAREGGWTIEPQWSRETYSEGPVLVTLRLAPDASEGERQRGLTTGMMRRLERHLTTLVELYADLGDWDSDNDELRSGVAELVGHGPRDRETYYEELLKLYVILKRRGRQPINVLATHLGIPKGTVVTRLNVAKRKHPELLPATSARVKTSEAGSK